LVAPCPPLSPLFFYVATPSKLYDFIEMLKSFFVWNTFQITRHFSTRRLLDCFSKISEAKNLIAVFTSY
jgi:hypothetical protein